MIRAVALDPTHLDKLGAALLSANLPTSDIGVPGRRFFQFQDDQGEVVGYGGLEGEGSDFLLRSIVVTGSRGRGIGSAIVAALESEASVAGATRLHVLTNSAASYFAGRGYQFADRSEAPASIANSAQFAGLCPASATYLVKPLSE